MEHYSEMPPMPDVVYKTAKTGNMHHGSTWIGGEVPAHHASIVINPGHTVTVTKSVTICGLAIHEGGALLLSPKHTIEFNNCGNVYKYGTIISHPLSGIFHTFRFKHVDESKFVGGGMDITESDVGYWVRGKGKFDFVGPYRTPWVRLEAGVAVGEKIITLNQNPVGWKVGDVLSIVPTKKGDITGFEERSIVRISGNKVTLNAPLDFDHPVVKNPFTGQLHTAEVINTTRNIIIEGTPGGHTHINIMGTEFQTFENVRQQYMGVRDVLGRYPNHLHHHKGGAVYKNVIILDSDNRGFVSHTSHNILYEGCVTLRTKKDPYWWDEPTGRFDRSNDSNNITWLNCIAADLRWNTTEESHQLSGFVFGAGKDNKCIGCVVVGNRGRSSSAGGTWRSSANYAPFNVWVVLDFLSHNNYACGFRNWQNDPAKHEVSHFVIYHCQIGIESGAYGNAYEWNHGHIFECDTAIEIHALAISKGGATDEWGYISHFNKILSTDPLRIMPHVLPGKPILVRESVFSSVIVDELSKSTAESEPGLFDFVNCEIGNYDVRGIAAGSAIRAQQKGKAFQLTIKGIESIPPFAK